MHLSLLSVCQVSLSRLRNIPEAKLGDAAGPGFLFAMGKWPVDDETVQCFKMAHSVGQSESFGVSSAFYRTSRRVSARHNVVERLQK